MPEQRKTSREFKVHYGGGLTNVSADFYIIDGNVLHFYRGAVDWTNPIESAKALSSTFRHWDKVVENG